MKKSIKRVLCLALALIICLSMAACGGSSAPAASNNSGNAADAGNDYKKVVIASASDPGNYLPFNATNSVRSAVQGFFYETLFNYYGENNAFIPVVAESKEVTGDGIYKIKIHDNVYDSQGNHITADDVVFCYETIIGNGECGTFVGEIAEVNKIDDYTIEFVFEGEKLGSFENAMYVCPIVSKKAYEESATGFSSDPVGTGPYYIADWQVGSSITLKKNENYWGKDGVVGFENQNVDEIVIKFIAEPAQATIEMETGNVDWAYNISTKDADTFVGRDGFTVESYPYHQTRTLAFNCDSSCVFSDVRLRQAVAYAIDAAAIVQGVYDGKGGVSTTLAIPEPEGGYSVDFVPSWKDSIPYEYNLEKAKELMAEAGYPNGGLKVKLMTKDMDEYRTTCQVIQAYLSQIGIEVEILAYENALYQTYRYDPTAFDMYICQFANNNSIYIPVGWKWYFNRSESTGTNVLFMDDDKLQTLLDAALDMDTHSDKTMDELWQYLKEECVAYPYCYTTTNYVHVDTITEPKMITGVTFMPNMSTFSSDYARHS